MSVGARGAYSFIQVGGVGGAEYDLLAEPVGGQVLTYADVCWRMLTYAEIC